MHRVALFVPSHEGIGANPKDRLAIVENSNIDAELRGLFIQHLRGEVSAPISAPSMAKGFSQLRTVDGKN